MTAIVLGLVAAFAYGLNDFVAGLLSRRVHFALVALIGNAVALAATLGALIVTTPPSPSSNALWWGVASGFGVGFGSLMLFRGLAQGRMGVVAPLSALATAVIPILIGVALGDRPSIIAWAGVLLALPAVWLVSTTGGGVTDGETDPAKRQVLASGAVDGLLAGVGFALLLVGLNFAGDGSGLWPVVAGEASSLVFLSVVLIGTVRRLGGLRLPRREAAAAGAVGVVGAVGAIAYFLSTQAGLLSIVAVLTSLYPAVTVVLAGVVLHEPIIRRQAMGLVLAGIAVVLIVLS
jgi:uncharacterized membrane protein